MEIGEKIRVSINLDTYTMVYEGIIDGKYAAMEEGIKKTIRGTPYRVSWRAERLVQRGGHFLMAGMVEFKICDVKDDICLEKLKTNSGRATD